MNTPDDQLRRGIVLGQAGLVLARPRMSRTELPQTVGNQQVEKLSASTEFESHRVFGIRLRDEWFAIAWSFHRDVLHECYLGILNADPGPDRADVGLKSNEHHKQWMRDHIGSTKKRFDGGAVSFDDYDLKRGSQGIYFEFWMPKVAPWWHRLGCRVCSAR